MKREFDSIWEAVESVLEACGRGDLTDRLSQERHEESQRHEAAILTARREGGEAIIRFIKERWIDEQGMLIVTDGEAFLGDLSDDLPSGKRST